VQSSKEILALTRRLAAMHRELGIPGNYAAERGLAPHVEAVESGLVEVGMNDEGRPILLVKGAAEAWAVMRRVAVRDDIELVPISGFRSIARQAEIIRDKLAAGQHLDEVLRYVAAPGYSEHHTGRALDIATADHIELDEEFEHTMAYRWLQQRAAEFGFTLSYPRNNPHRIGFEPWHWCWSATAGR
jgi:zinc D-Ala-D-Ala carboxypeptidase